MFVSSANIMNESNFVTEHKSFMYRRKRFSIYIMYISKYVVNKHC